jgi:hypothetical protein
MRRICVRGVSFLMLRGVVGTVRVLRRVREGVQGQGGSQAPTPPLTCWTLRIRFLKRCVGKIYSLSLKIFN